MSVFGFLRDQHSDVAGCSNTLWIILGVGEFPYMQQHAFLTLGSIFQTLSTAYAAEVMPVSLRAYLTANINMCWLIGQLCGVGVVYAFVNTQSEWAYRIPFGLQWAFAVPILIGVIFAPESPCE